MTTINDLFGAAEQARAAAIEDANNSAFVGELHSVDNDDRIATYLFELLQKLMKTLQRRSAMLCCSQVQNH
jgi:hypothetical protein